MGVGERKAYAVHLSLGKQISCLHHEIACIFFFNVKYSKAKFGRQSQLGSQGHWSPNTLAWVGWSSCIRAACSTDPLPREDGRKLTATQLSRFDSRGHRVTSAAANVKLEMLEHSRQRHSFECWKIHLAKHMTQRCPQRLLTGSSRVPISPFHSSIFLFIRWEKTL